MCDAVESSREHSPPSCLFPAMEDIRRDLRQNLVTVPSCDGHNSKKSKDDEFLRAVILQVAVNSSEIAQNQFMGKLLRAVERKPHVYSSFFSVIENDNVVPHQPIHDAVDVTREFLKSEIIKGQNPEVFKYRLRYDDATRIYAFAAIFYDFFEVYSISSPVLTGAGLDA